MKEASFTSRYIWAQYYNGTKIDKLEMLVGLERRAIYYHIQKFRDQHKIPRCVLQKDVKKWLSNNGHHA